MVIHLRYKIHCHKPKRRGKKLLFKIIGRVVKTHSAIIFAGGKKHDKSKCNENQYKDKKEHIYMTFLPLFLF